MHRRKKIFLNERKTRYCYVRIYSNKKSMQAAINKECPGVGDCKYTLGMHHAYIRLFVMKGQRTKYIPETGIIYLSKEHCGAGVATHEIMHAILWAHKHNKNKEQYPITISTMNEEEAILRNFTYAVKQFYKWYWKIEKQIK